MLSLLDATCWFSFVYMRVTGNRLIHWEKNKLSDQTKRTECDRICDKVVCAFYIVSFPMSTSLEILEEKLKSIQTLADWEWGMMASTLPLLCTTLKATVSNAVEFRGHINRWTLRTIPAWRKRWWAKQSLLDKSTSPCEPPEKSWRRKTNIKLNNSTIRM